MWYVLIGVLIGIVLTIVCLTLLIDGKFGG